MTKIQIYLSDDLNKKVESIKYNSSNPKPSKELIIIRILEDYFKAEVQDEDEG